MNALLVKKGLSRLLSASGLLGSIERRLLKENAFVLMYHRVIPSSEPSGYVHPGMYVSVASFERQMACLAANLRVVHLEDLVDRLVHGRSIGGFCAVTFDDGWQDNFSTAFPVLRRYRIPATIFLATGFVGTSKIFWPEELCHYLEQPLLVRQADPDAPEPFVRYFSEICAYRSYGRDLFLDRATARLKQYAHDQRLEIMAYLRQRLGPWDGERQILNWAEVREMHASGWVCFGAHTVNHQLLDQIPLQQVREEVHGSAEQISASLGSRPKCFAYPNGNHSPDICRIVEESRFQAALTTVRGFLKKDTSLMLIPRIAVHEDVSDSTAMFRSRILLRSF